MRILKFKSQLTIALFVAVNHLNGPLRKQNFTLTGWKGHGFWFVIGGFRSVLCVSVFQGLLLVIVYYDPRQWKTQLWRRLLNFRVRMFVKSAVTSVTNVCEAVPISLFWASNRLNKLPEVCFLIDKSTLACLTGQSWYNCGAGPTTMISALLT